jgi:hypothetical protein
MTQSLILSAIGFGVALAAFFFVRRHQAEQAREKEEIEAVYEIARQVSASAQRAMHELQRIREEDWPRSRAELNAAIDGYLNEHRSLLAGRVEEVVDGKFFWRAAKAALPRQVWKDEFKEYSSQPERQLLDQTVVRNDLTGMVRSGEERFVNLLASEVYEKHGGVQLSENSQNAFERVKANPERFRELVGSNEEFTTLLRSQALPDLMKGAALISAGLLLKDSLDGEWTIEMFGQIMGEILGNEALAQLADEIKDWIIAEVGEQIFLEVAEAIAAALTAVGVVFFIYKLGKYTWLAKRLFYDREPLQKMRERALTAGRQSLEMVGDEAKRRFEERIAALFEELETRLKALHSAADERKAWALQRLPAHAA